MIYAVAAVLFATALPLHTDSLTPLRTAVERMTGREPLSVTVDLRRSRHSKGRFMNEDFEGSAAAEVTEDAAGMHVVVSRALLGHAADEAWLHELDPKHADGSAHAVAELVPESLADIVDFAPSLNRLLSRARVVGQRNSIEAGRAVHVYVLALPPTSSGSEVGAVHFTDDHFTVAVGADGLPVSAQRVRKGSAGFMFIRVETVRTESWTFATRGDHLLVTRLEDGAVVSGAGQSGEARSVWTVRAR